MMDGHKEPVQGVDAVRPLGRGECQEGGVPGIHLQEESEVAPPLLW